MEAATTELIDVTIRLPRTTVRHFMEIARSDRQDMSTRRMAVAKAVLAGRQCRASAFAGLRFVEPAWDMILAIYIAAREGHRMNVLKLCAASGASNMTALRLIESLEERQYVVRKPDDADARIILIVMLPALETALNGWLDTFGETMRFDAA